MLGKNYKYTGLAAMLAPLNCDKIEDEDDENDDGKPTPTAAAANTKSAATAVTTSSFPEQKAPNGLSSNTSNHHVNAQVGSMEGHSSLAAYSQHHHPHHQYPHPQQQQQDYPAQQAGNHGYYHQNHHYGGQGPSGMPSGQPYGHEYGDPQASTSSAGPSTSQQVHPHHQFQHQHSFDPSQHSYQQQQQHHQYNQHIPPHSAPPQQRNFAPQYPTNTKVGDPGGYGGQVNRNVNAPPPIVTKSLPPPAPPPSAPPAMTPRKTPPVQKRQPNAQEQQRVDFEVARNVSQILNKNGMKVSQQEQIVMPVKQLPPLAPVPSGKGPHQCPTCPRVVSNAKNLQRHMQTCGQSAVLQAQVSAAPQLAAMLQRSPPPPSTSSSGPPSSQFPSSASTSSASTVGVTLQHHSSTGSIGYSQLYSPNEIIGDPNIMLSDGYEYKDDPILFQGTSSGVDMWARDDSFGVLTMSDEPTTSANHQRDSLDVSDPLGFQFDGLDADHHKEAPRDFLDHDDLSNSLDHINPPCNNNFFGQIDPEMDIGMALEPDEPLLRSESASLSCSSQGRSTPASATFIGFPFSCDSCKKGVSSERSLRRHYSTCKAYQADLMKIPLEERPQPKRRNGGGGGGNGSAKRSRKPKVPVIAITATEDEAELQAEPEPEPVMIEKPQPPQQQQNSAILAALAAPPNRFQAPVQPLPSLNASWLPSRQVTSSRSSDMFTPPMASSTPIPPVQHKSSPLQELLMEDEPEDDGDSRSSNGTVTTKPAPSQMFSCEGCSKQLASFSNLKRHRATCKHVVSQPATPAPSSSSASASLEHSAPPSFSAPLSVQVPATAASTAPSSASSVSQHHETLATVTYTKSSWNSNGPPTEKLISPKQQKASVVMNAANNESMTVGEALRSKQLQQKQAAQVAQAQAQVQAQQMQAQQIQSQIQLPGQRIPPRPPNPILNQMQNPPREVQQMQQTQSRQAPQSQAQIVHHQLPPLSNAQLHAQLHLQSPQKKGLIEHKNTDLVLITSEPLPSADKRIDRAQQIAADKRRASDGQVLQNQQSLPPLQLPQRKPTAPAGPQVAYQVQFSNRPLPPMQLPPLQAPKPQSQQQQPQSIQMQQKGSQMQMMPQQQQQEQMYRQQGFQQRQMSSQQAPQSQRQGEQLQQQRQMNQVQGEHRQMSSQQQQQPTMMMNQMQEQRQMPVEQQQQQQRQMNQQPQRQMNQMPVEQQMPQQQQQQQMMSQRMPAPMKSPPNQVEHQQMPPQQPQQVIRTSSHLEQKQQQQLQHQMEDSQKPRVQPPMNQSQMQFQQHPHQQQQQQRAMQMQMPMQNQQQQQQRQMAQEQQHRQAQQVHQQEQLRQQQEQQRLQAQQVHQQEQQRQLQEQQQRQEQQRQEQQRQQQQAQAYHQQQMQMQMPRHVQQHQQQQQDVQKPMHPQQQQLQQQHQLQQRSQQFSQHPQQHHQQMQLKLPPLAPPQVPPVAPRKPSQDPPAKRMRSQSNATKPSDEFSAPRAKSPLDSIITTAPLSVEVHHQPKEPEQVPPTSIDSQITAPSPKKKDQQAYICPECSRVYSCRKNVKRHRMAVHKLTLEEVHAKPEDPAPDDYTGPVGGPFRRHTVAGLGFEKTPSSTQTKKRKASAATTASNRKSKGTQKKTKTAAAEKTPETETETAAAEGEKNKVVEPTGEKEQVAPEPSESPAPAPALVSQTNHHQPDAPREPEAVVTPRPSQVPTPDEPQAYQAAQMTLPPMESFRKVAEPMPKEKQPLPSFDTFRLTPKSPTDKTPMSAPVQHALPSFDSIWKPAEEPSTYFQPQEKTPISAPANQALPSFETFRQSPALQTLPPFESSFQRPTPPATLPSIQSFQPSTSAFESFRQTPPAPNLATLQMPPVQESTSSAAETTGQDPKEDDAKAMAKIAAELKRSAEKWPPDHGLFEGVDDLEMDELLMQQIRNSDTLEDVGDIAHLLDGMDDDMLDRVLGDVPKVPLSSTASSSLPSLSSPDEQYLQYQQYQQQQMMWNEQYQQQQQQQFELAPEQQQQVQQVQMAPMEPPQQQQVQLHPPVIDISEDCQESLILPTSDEPIIYQRMKPGRKQREPIDLHCPGCKKLLGSEYSLRRHKGGCAGVQKKLYPDYPKPPRRRTAQKAVEITRAEIIASMPTEEELQLQKERRAAAAEAVVERLESLPPPSIVHDVLMEINVERMKMRQEQASAASASQSQQTTSPPPEGTASGSPLADSLESTSSASSTASTSQMECNKHFSNEWNLDRHKREACKQQHSFESVAVPKEAISIQLMTTSNL